jgi:predicted DNA-binding transcriptional regulator AlpA
MTTACFVVDAKSAAALLGVSVRMFHELRHTQDFPQGHLLGERTVRWIAEDLKQWLKKQPTAATRPEPNQLARSRAGGDSLRQTPPTFPFPQRVDSVTPAVSTDVH